VSYTQTANFGRAIPIRATATGEGLMCRLMNERFSGSYF
jgi:hypothetical protein